MEKFNFGGDLYVKERVAVNQQAKIDKLEAQKKELVEALDQVFYYTAMRDPQFNTHKQACDAIENLVAPLSVKEESEK